MKPGHDLGRLITYAMRDDWRDALDEAMSDHLGAALEEFQISIDDIGDILGNHYIGTLFGCALEDLMTRRFEPGDDNVVDDYLKRRGWNETAPAKAYMRALQQSATSLYEASNIVAGRSFMARDLVRGGEPILVDERTATKTLAQWDRIAARIVPERGGHVISGALLPFSHEGAETLLAGLRDAEGAKRRTGPLSIDDRSLAAIAPLFTTAWLFDVLPKALGLSTPVFTNNSGDALVFHRVFFPLSRGVRQDDVAVELDKLASLEPESPRFWNWLEPEQPVPASRDAKGARAKGTAAAEEAKSSLVLGTIELKGRSLILAVNSAERAVTGTRMLNDALSTRIGKPLTEIETVAQAMGANSGPEPSSNELPLSEITPLVHAMLDKQYRGALDEPVPMLGQMTPRQASKTAGGRKRLVEWLKYLETTTERSSDIADPMRTYDFTWMWRELEVEQLRK